ncbi:DegT/DnrJ/EryC1/StrS family aminotransferase [Mesorhizobium sp. ES1-1]|uniref:DegT/DnrJ/EryC1/StrS family aminotransferase n=1 Tax=Mesorhizobium sp. ES1-1 TaxID=2876629 RepID=UPI001CCCCB6C|nr:DegT/DnrJ/EryC1/StrS aminotransferase family protein [Mesorhizobium sp. ES1-1]MBZ9674733.1 DegT/DnrJ/EryC1/StrS aminotransferase family protein [Mesorhizobium sp. ES1-1]
MLNTSFSPWPSFSPEEGDLVRNVLLSNRVNYWTGDEGRSFEREFAEWVGTSHAIALANGTVAMDVAWIALGIKPGDEIVVTPRTFLASASSIVNAGAIPVFADVDPDSQNITAETVARVLTPRTKAILAVHLAGWPCEMDGLRDLATARGLYLVEDCAQAHGARYRGKAVGGLGDIAAWSFCQDKIMTTAGEGGMVTTDNKDWWSRMWSYKDHGKAWEAVYERQHPPGFRWLHESFGTNWRLPEIQSAVGRFQLRRMDDWHRTRTHNAQAILEAAGNSAVLRVPDMPDHIEHAWYKCYLFVRPEALKADWTRDRMISEIVARGVPCYSGSCSEVYLEKAFDGTGWRPAERLPVARELGDTSLMFLVHPTLTDAEIEMTQSVIRDVSRLAQR